jgi:hypothetical protein
MTTNQKKEYHGGGGPGGVIRMTTVTKAMSDKQDEIEYASMSKRKEKIRAQGSRRCGLAYGQ